jgi:hypothetical protein
VRSEEIFGLIPIRINLQDVRIFALFSYICVEVVDSFANLCRFVPLAHMFDILSFPKNTLFSG